jgi:hypothetical protein
MEERLDDAINVLRSHCEPQLNLPIGMDPASLSGHSSFVPTAPQSQSTSSGLNQDAAVALPLDIPVKVERTTVPSASSEFVLTPRPKEFHLTSLHLQRNERNLQIPTQSPAAAQSVEQRPAKPTARKDKDGSEYPTPNGLT